MSGQRGSTSGIVLRALGMGVGVMIVLPVIIVVAVLAIGHLAGDCGPGSSGGCEMGAAGLGLYSIVPGFLLGAGWSVFRDLRKK